MLKQYSPDNTDPLPDSCYSTFKTESEYLTKKRAEVKARFAGKLLTDNPSLKITLHGPTVLVK